MIAIVACERAALARIWQRAGIVALALLGAEVGALGLAAAIVRFRDAFAGHSLEALGVAAGGVGLGLDLAIVLGSLGFGAAIVALARPIGGRALFMPSTSASAGTVSITAVTFVVLYAMTLGLSRLATDILGRDADPFVRAALLALSLTPPLMIAAILIAAAIAAIALVGRGLRPGRALASGIDHVLRQPGQAIAIATTHAALAILLARSLHAMHGLPKLVVLAPLCSFVALLAVAAFDAAITRDARIATG